MKILVLIFSAFAICLATGTEKLAFNWNGFSNPFLSNAFLSLHRSAEKDSDNVERNELEPVMGMIRLQSARVAEMSLSAKPLNEMQCFKRIVCIVGATGGSVEKVDDDAEIVVTKNQPITLAKGIEQFVNMLQSMTETIETDMNEFPIIQQIIGSHTAGASTNDVSLCETLFPCATHASDLDIPTHRREGRATCKAINAVCPGIQIGCALCAGFLPGQCGNQCIIAGLYCGSSIIACGQQKKNSSRRKPKIMPNTGIYF